MTSGSTEAVMVRYYAFDLGERQAGLIRYIRDDEAKTVTMEAVQGGRWVDDPSLIRFFEQFGGTQLDLIELTESEARERAAELGVSLDATVKRAACHS